MARNAATSAHSTQRTFERPGPCANATVTAASTPTEVIPTSPAQASEYETASLWGPRTNSVPSRETCGSGETIQPTITASSAANEFAKMRVTSSSTGGQPSRSSGIAARPAETVATPKSITNAKRRNTGSASRSSRYSE